MNDIVLEIPWLLPTLFWATGLAIGYAIHAIGVRIAKQTVDAHAATTEARAKHEAEVILRGLIRMSLADGRISDDERALLRAFGGRLGLSESDIDGMIKEERMGLHKRVLAAPNP